MGHLGLIAYVTEEGTIRVIHVRSAEPSATIPTLSKHYQEFSKVKDLVNLGDCESVEAKVYPREGTPHSFENPQDDVTLFYARDGSENQIVKIREYDFDTDYDLEEEKKNVHMEALYMFMDNKWFYADIDSDFEFRPVIIKKRPRGRAPNGKKWCEINGKWV